MATKRITLPSGGWWEIETQPKWKHIKLLREDDPTEKFLAALTVAWSFEDTRVTST